MSLRKITSLTALLSFTALVVSSVFSYLAPRGPGSSQWEAMGLGKHDWFSLHTNLGVLFLVACIVHTILNIKPVIAYLKNKRGKFRLFTLNFNIALLLTAWIVASSLLDWPPVNAIQNYKSTLRNQRHHRDAVEEKHNPLPEKPPFLYSRKSLSRLCHEYQLDESKTLNVLKNIGIDAQASWTIKRIASENNTDPQAVYDVIRQVQ